MTHCERFTDLIVKTYQMRQAQKNYFKTRDPQWLRESKRLENEVDAILQKEMEGKEQ